jgi:acetyl esterase
LALAAQLLIYPDADMSGRYADEQMNARYPSRIENANGYFTTLPLVRWTANHYLADEKSSSDWRASPLRARSLAGVAPAVVCTAQFRFATKAWPTRTHCQLPTLPFVAIRVPV